MRIAVVSDIHANGDALEAVARELERLRPDRVVHLGDLVGYNAEPEKCVRWAMEACSDGILGNHDAVVCGKASGEFFHRLALEADRWSASRLSGEAVSYLAGLPVRTELDGGILLSHGAPSDPDRYLFRLDDAEEELTRIAEEGRSTILLFGHTHLPAAYRRRRDGFVLPAPLAGLRWAEGEIVLLNPGSVGQPRDRDPRASFLCLDTVARTADWVRVPYDVEGCRRKVIAAGLPRFFADRLADGA
ncbi:MAG: metallophosphoesterase family protein [Deltaproteobacteria bacterium]